jgi:hypothetical protein
LTNEQKKEILFRQLIRTDKGDIKAIKTIWYIALMNLDDKAFLELFNDETVKDKLHSLVICSKKYKLNLLRFNKMTRISRSLFRFDKIIEQYAKNENLPVKQIQVTNSLTPNDLLGLPKVKNV